MKKGEAFMKILKCQNDICYLNINGQDKKILEITKEDILSALEYSYSNDDIELEEYDKEGKTHVVIGIGCTGGQHRSVSLTNYFADHYSQKYHVHRLHRDAVH